MALTDLRRHNLIKIKQIRELMELFGFETRNKYSIQDASGEQIGFAAEQGKGILGLILRSYFGHWRPYEIHFFDANRIFQFKAYHPFRWFFHCLEVYDSQNKFIGKLEQRWGVFTKKFDVHDQNGNVIAEMRSGFFRLWTFPVKRNGQEYAFITKKWGGVLKELFLDADSFAVEFKDSTMPEDQRRVLLTAAVFVDLQYFEAKAD